MAALDAGGQPNGRTRRGPGVGLGRAEGGAGEGDGLGQSSRARETELGQSRQVRASRTFALDQASGASWAGDPSKRTFSGMDPVVVR